MLIEELTPAPDVVAALECMASLPGVVLFDSVRTSAELGQWSFLTADPFRWIEIPAGSVTATPFESLRRALQEYAVPRQADWPPFVGGAAGLLSYELGQCFERLPSPRHDDARFPWLAVGLYDWVIAWDHRNDRCWLIAHGWPAVEESTRREAAADRLRWIRERLAASDPPSTYLFAESSAMPAGFRPLSLMNDLWSNFSRAEYLAAVQRVIEYIAAGDIFQANLSQRLLYRSRWSPLELYRRLRERNPAPFAGFWQSGGRAVLSASPERFLQVRSGVVETRPIKGTRRRELLPEADLFTRDELRGNPKDRAENVMIVDLLRNDLSRVCTPGSIEVPRLCEVETYETVQHLVSVVRGRLAPDRDVWDVLAATFPGGSITGAPKIRAMEIITELEQRTRGPYCGNLFYLGFDGTADSSILIRTFALSRGWIECGVGGGIVIDSLPVNEYEETLDKAEGMLRALRD